MAPRYTPAPPSGRTISPTAPHARSRNAKADAVVSDRKGIPSDGLTPCVRGHSRVAPRMRKSERARDTLTQVKRPVPLALVTRGGACDA